MDGQLRSRRPGRHLRDRDRPVGPAEPLHVGERVRHPERAERGRADLVDAGVLGPADVARQQHRPLDPRVAQHVQRRRLVVGDRRPHRRAAHASRCRRCAPRRRGTPPAVPARRGSAARRRSQPSSAGAVVQPVRRLRAGAGRRLRDQREADLAGEAASLARRRAPARGGRTARRLRAARPSSGACPGRCARCSTSMPSMPMASRTWRAAPAAARAHPRAARPRPICPASPLTASGDLARVQRVLDPPVPGEAVPQRGAIRPAASQVITPSRTPGREAAHLTKRAVASSRYGATNAAATMPGTLPLPVVEALAKRPRNRRLASTRCESSSSSPASRRTSASSSGRWQRSAPR